MKLLVCGGRDFNNAARVQHVLYAIHQRRPITQQARENGIKVMEVAC